MIEVDELFKKVDKLKEKYESHFSIKFPERIIGWWEPLNITNYPDELEKGVTFMEKDVNKAIKTNTPIEEIPEEIWNTMIF